jgi:ketosteroid isomerase-like protein
MSLENVEIVRRSTEALISGDAEAALAPYHPDVVVDARVRPEGSVYHGREGVVEAMRVWIGAWEDWKIEMSEYLDAGDKVVAIGRESGRGKASGLVIDQVVYLVLTLEDGQIVRWQGLLERDQALEAAGLAE